MKKPILCTLLAVLLICLLTACVSEAPTPTPGTSGTETTAEPSPDETTTASADITSDAPEGTTAEITTADPVTTYQEAWETDQNGYPYVLLSPTYPDSETGDGTPIKVADTEMPWYITEWETAQAVTPQEASEAFDGYALHVPKVTEVVTNGFKLKVESYQEYYRPGDCIQLRITIENTGAEAFTMTYSPYGQFTHHPYFVQIDALDFDMIYGEQTRIGWPSFHLLPKTHDNLFYLQESHINTDNEDPYFVIYPEGTPKEEAVSNGNKQVFLGSVTLEISITVSPERANVNGSYMLWINPCIFRAEDEGGNYYRLPIPVEFVPVAWVKPS